MGVSNTRVIAGERLIRYLPDQMEPSERLILRKPTLDDAEEFFANSGRHATVARHLDWQPHTSVGESRNFLRICLDDWDQEIAFSYVIAQKDAPQHVAGMVQLIPEGHSLGMILWISQPDWRHGYAIEVTRWLGKWAPARPEVWRIYTACPVENVAAVTAMQKVGWTTEGVLRRLRVFLNASSDPLDCVIFSRTSD